MQSSAFDDKAFDKLYHDAQLEGITGILTSHRRLFTRLTIPGSTEQARLLAKWIEDWEEFTREWTECDYDPAEVAALEAAGLKPPELEPQED